MAGKKSDNGGKKREVSSAPSLSKSLAKQFGLDDDAPAKENPKAKELIADAKTDKAVDDIIASEASDATSDEESSQTDSPRKQSRESGFKAKLKQLLKNKWTYIVLIIVVIVAIFAIPATRWPIVGVVIKKTTQVTITDSKTNIPVSGADVTLHGKTVTTNGKGVALVKTRPGSATLTVSKKYYKDLSQKVSIKLFGSTKVSAKFVATGRQVPVVVTDKIGGKPLAEAEVKVLGTMAKTDAHGEAIVALPTKSATYKATISLKGYNNLNANIVVTSSTSKSNDFTLTPTGKVYFLSNLSGTIDVVKTNLDGSDRETVLKGTGSEDPSNTSILASHDWRYLVLKAQRSANSPGLYIIDTATDNSTEFDNGNANFNLIGWSGHTLLYDTTSTSASLWQSGHEKLKAYDADQGQLNVLDNAGGTGDQNAYAYQSFGNFDMVGGSQIVYTSMWYTYSVGTSNLLDGKTDAIRGINANGSGKQDYQTFDPSSLSYIGANMHSPSAIYYSVYNYQTSSNDYYEFSNNSVSKVNIDDAAFNKTYPTYLLSPSGNKTFWSDVRDGSSALFVGSNSGANATQVATLNGYTPYAWYTDKYILVSKNGSELDIMPAQGYANTSSKLPLKVTDYYAGGYGGGR